MSEVQISPLAKRLAEENSIDWRKIRGTGPEGRVIERDILTYLARIMSGEADLPAEPDKSEPAGPSSMPAAVPGNVANYAAASAGLAKEGVDLSALIGGFPSASSLPTLEAPLDFGSFEPAPPTAPPTVFSSPPSTINTSLSQEPVFEIDFDDDESEIVFENPTMLDEPDVPAIQEPVWIAPVIEPVVTEPAWVAPQTMTSEPAWTAAVPAPEPIMAAAVIEPATPVVSAPLWTSSVESATVPTPVVSEPIWAAPVVPVTPEPVWTVPTPVEPEIAPVWVTPTPSLPVQEPAWSMPEPIAPFHTEPVVPVIVVPEPVYVAPPEPVYVAPSEPIAPEAVYTSPAVLEPKIPESVFVAPPADEEKPTFVTPILEPVAPVVIPEPNVIVSVPETPTFVSEPVALSVVSLPEIPTVVSVPEIPVVVSVPEIPVAIPTYSPPTSTIIKDYFQLFAARRDFDQKALEAIRANLSSSLNNREIPNELFLARAVGRAIHLLGIAQFTIARLEHNGLQAYQVSGIQHSFIEALQGLTRATQGSAEGLLVVDASSLGADDLLLPSASGVLALGRNGKLTLSGNLPPLQSTEFLSKVAELLENPVGLVV